MSAGFGEASIVIDPTGKNITCNFVYPLQPAEPERNRTKQRTFNQGIASSGTNNWSFQGPFFLDLPDYDLLERVLQRSNQELETGTSPFGEIVIYNFVIPRSETAATRTYMIVPSQDNPNPHLLEDTDNGDGTFDFKYYVVQQGFIELSNIKRFEQVYTFDLNFIESTLRLASEE